MASIVCCYFTGYHPHLHSFPTRRSSDLAPLSATVDLVNRGVWALSHVSSTQKVSPSLRMTARSITFCSRSEEHSSELQSHSDIVCRLLLEKKNTKKNNLRNHDQKPRATW